MDADALRQYLEFYQDLHIETLYRRMPVTPPAPPVAAAIAAPELKMELPPLAPPNETLFQILQDIGDCHRCRLGEGRNQLVFGVGNEQSPLVFVGEGPGADEDEQGIPFVGRAGVL